MGISIIEPLERAYAHMKGMLFAPFDLSKWLVVGFSCWLARLAGGFGGGGNVPTGIANLGDDADGATLATWDWLESVQEHSALLGCGGLLLFLVVFSLVLISLLIWLSSRGHFIFLDNVVRDRAEIKEPWNRFATQGNSLFLWQIGFIFAALFLLLAAAVPLLTIFFSLQNRGDFGIGETAAVVAGVLPVAAVAVGLAYTHMFLVHFVVPIMHREGLATNAAWGRFLPLLRNNLGSFLIYGLFILLLWFGVGFALLLVIVFTCCIAAIPLLIPYISTVTLLPVYVVFRAFGVEFLGQLLPSVGLPAPAAVGDETG